MALKILVPDRIWHAQQPLRPGPLAITTRMTVLRLDNGSLRVHSPVRPSPELRAARAAARRRTAASAAAAARAGGA